MKIRFHLTTGVRKPANRLEAHLISVAKDWAEGKGLGVGFTSLADFHRNLVKEKQWFLRDNNRIRSTSVRLAIDTKTGLISIWPAGSREKPSLTIGIIVSTIQQPLTA